MAWKETLKRHYGLAMIAVCILVIATLFTGIKYMGIPQSSLYWLALLLCPLMHFFMMKDMHKGHDEDDRKGHEKKGGCH